MSDLTGQKAVSGNIRGVLSEIHPVYKIDTELNKEGYAADAKATGDAIVLAKSEAISYADSLTAADVGARPNTWTPTASDVGAVPTTRKVNNKALSSDISLTASEVGARPDTWLPTIEEIGAAPSGYGLGGAPSYITDCNTVTDTGWYKWDSQASNAPFANGIMQVIGRVKDASALQTAYMMAASGILYSQTRRINKSTGVYDEWEYDNPPMTLGTEYRTTERHNGKPVYIMAFNAGSMPNNKTLRVTLPGKIQGQEIIHTALRIKSGSNSMQMAYGADPGYFIEGTNLALTTTGDFSSYTATATFKYTKD